MSILDCYRFKDTIGITQFNHIKRPASLKSVDCLSFSLARKEGKREVKQPDYSGTFTLPTDIILKAGVKYVYGGWSQTDNSINLKFTPASQLKTVRQTTLDSEPEHTKDILSRMYTGLSPEDDEI